MFYSRRTLSGHTSSNDTGLIHVSCPGAESIAGQTNRHTDIFGYYNIDKLKTLQGLNRKFFGITFSK
jgi:hypothetical protein